MSDTTITTPTLSQNFLSKFTTMVYGWMTFGLLITAVIAFFISEAVLNDYQLATRVSDLMLPMFIAQLVLVIAISRGAERFSPAVTSILFSIYAASNGLLFGAILATMEFEVVALTFLATMLTFGIMAIYGTVTKQDLTRWGSIAYMGLIGLIIGTILNMFLASNSADWVLTYAGLLIFVVLTAYDAQKIKAYAAYSQETGIAPSKLAVSAALALYLDFINLFLYILRIFSRD